MSSVLRTTVLLAALTALFLVIGGALGGNQGWSLPSSLRS